MKSQPVASKLDDDDDDDASTTAYELVVCNHVPLIDPKKYGIRDIKAVDPNDYFITSGDAVVKATHLQRDLCSAANKAGTRFKGSKNKKHQKFQADIRKAASQAKKLLNTLKEIRGKHIFLETDWKDHHLYCIPKDPRNKDPLAQ